MLLTQLLREMWSAWRSAGAPAAPQSAPGAAYSDAVFRQRDLQAAKEIILNPAPDMTTDERWEFETRAVVEEMGRAMQLDATSRVLDYGCGIGRIAKALIERYGCSVLGVDISADMRRFAVDYVASERFRTCEPAELDRLVKLGYSATAACACWAAFGEAPIPWSGFDIRIEA